MSKLGKIFIVRYNTGEYSKEVYPIVYENQERYVCKVPGCHEIREFIKDNSRYGVITVEEYESYEGCHGLMDWEDVRNGRRESFGEEPAKMMLEKDISNK